MGHSCEVSAKSRLVMTRRFVEVLGCCLVLLISAGDLRAQDWQTARRPLGVYAHLDIPLAITRYLQTLPSHLSTGACSALPGGVPSSQVRAGLRRTYKELLADNAVSGIAAGSPWCLIQVRDPACIADHSCPADYPDGYDWSYLDDIFAEANAAHKSVQLLITPAVDSPSWLLAKLASCDGLFFGPEAGRDCGKVTFTAFPESQRAASHELPMPWSGPYISAWHDFLKRLNNRYGSNNTFVSIAVAGPICASTEIILPTTANKSFLSTPRLSPGQPDLQKVHADTMWQKLIENRFPDNAAFKAHPDQVFIDHWTEMIEAYEQIFNGVTLIVTPDIGDDLPALGTLLPQDQADPIWNADCAWNQTVSCQAKARILSDFAAARGPNEKATDVGGMTASSSLTPGDIGVPGVKELTSMSTSPPILGGAEFDFSVSEAATRQEEGCTTRPTPKQPKPCTNLTTEEATFNVLKVFFNGTTVADHYGGARGTQPIQFVDLDYVDIEYAHAANNQCPPDVSARLGETSMQDLLNRASHDLYYIAGMSTLLPPPTCTRQK